MTEFCEFANTVPYLPLSAVRQCVSPSVPGSQRAQIMLRFIRWGRVRSVECGGARERMSEFASTLRAFPDDDRDGYNKFWFHKGE